MNPNDIVGNLKNNLIIYQRVIPAYGDCKQEGEVIAELLKGRNAFLTSLLDDQIVTKHVRDDKELSLLLYRLIYNNLFANLAELQCPDDDESLNDTGPERVSLPMLNFIQRVTSEWPIESCSFMHFTHETFLINLTKLFLSPIEPERRAVEELITLTIRKLRSLHEDGKNVPWCGYTNALLTQLGLALLDAKDCKNAERFLKSVFEILPCCIGNCDPVMLGTFMVTYFPSFVRSAQFLEYSDKIGMGIVNIISRNERADIDDVLVLSLDVLFTARNSPKQ